MIRIKKSDFRFEMVPDDCPDTTFLEEDRLLAYSQGKFSFVGIQASVDLRIPYGLDTICTRVYSPGCWGIESDLGDVYFNEIFEEERNILADLLNGQTVVVE